MLVFESILQVIKAAESSWIVEKKDKNNTKEFHMNRLNSVTLFTYFVF
jgi:hypothetical protein